MDINAARVRAFTLIELLVVIAITSVLIALLLPALGKAQESAENIRCMSRLRQMALITHTYTDDHAGQAPEFIFSFDAGSSTNIVVLIIPKHATTTGLSYYLDDLTTCPSDDDPGPVPYVDEDGNTGIKHVSYGVNIDLTVRNIDTHRLNQPSEIAFMFDGFITGPGEDPYHMQGLYKGSMEMVDRMFVPRHNKLANVQFFDGHVEQYEELTPEMIAENGEPYEFSPGNGGGGSGGGGGGSGGGSGGGKGGGKK